MRGYEIRREKYGGRQAGTPNKRTLELIEQLDARNFDVIDELLKLYPNLERKGQAKVLCDLLQYLYPKRKAIEVEAGGADLLKSLLGMPEDQRAALRADYEKRLAQDVEPVPSEPAPTES